MSKPSPSTTKKIRASLGALLPAILLTLLLGASGFTGYLDRTLYDILLTRRIETAPEPLNPRIIPVDLDDRSEKALGQALTDRSAFAGALSVLGDLGAGAGMDFIFKTPAAGDPLLAEAAGGIRRLVLAAAPVEKGYPNFSHDELTEEEREILRKSLWRIRELPGGRIPEAGNFILSNPEISRTADQLGHIAVRMDPDGKYRRAPLFYRWEDGVIPSLPLAMAAGELGIDPGAVEFVPGKEIRLPLPGGEVIRIPADGSGAMLVPYTEKWSESDYRIPLANLAEAGTDRELFGELMYELAGSLALVSDTTTAQKDFGSVPFERVYPLSGIHTAVLSGILEGYFFREQGPFLKGLFAVLCLLAAAALGLCKSDGRYNRGFLALFLGCTAAQYLLWRGGNFLPWYGLLSAGIFLAWAWGFGGRLFFRYREQLLFKSALSRYFPRALAERIAAEGKTELAPAYKELSILFADISGFTKWSAEKNPEDVHRFLSDYLETMAGILFAHGGTVDKFMGDGILAFFGDPFEQPDHPDRCLRAAAAMQKEAAVLREKWKTPAGIDLKIRIGVNTGRVIVGNLGTKTRIEYTVIGAAANLAQRMESAAPPGGILVTAQTRRAAGERFSFSEKREVAAKGYDVPIEAYELRLQEGLCTSKK